MHFDTSLTTWLGDALLQTSALLLLSLLFHRLLRKASAAMRHTLLLFATFSIPLLIVLSFALPFWSPPAIPALQTITEIVQTYEVGKSHVTAPTTSEALVRPQDQNTPSSPLSITFRITTLWAFGVILLWSRLGLGILLLSRHKAPSSQNVQLEDILTHESTALGLKTTPKLILLKGNAMPMTWKLRRHTLALPETSTQWPKEKLLGIIRHELAHIRRNDCRTAWLAEASLSLLWFHPLTWLLRRALERSREAACDDLALGDSPDQATRLSYADSLLEIISTHSRLRLGMGLALAMAKKNSSLHQRLGHILDTESNRHPLSAKTQLLMAPVWLLGIAALASLGACRSIDTSDASKQITSPPPSDSQVKVNGYVVEFENPQLLEKLFKTKAQRDQFITVLSPEERDRVLKKITSSGHKLKQLPGPYLRFGMKGTAEVYREFIYPTEYSPPQLPEKPLPSEPSSSSGVFPVTPATPTHFDTRKIGYTYEAQVSQPRSGFSNLDIHLTHCQFLGFINYGSPIMTPGKDWKGSTVPVVVTENRIEMPIFLSKSFKNSFKIRKGDTIAMIGFAQEQDKSIYSKLTKQPELEPAKHVLYLIQPEFLKTK